MTTAEAVLEDAERREARESYRRTGGSKRRPLKSFKTDREKREAREEHAARIHAAIAELSEPIAFYRWVETSALNPQLTPLNAVLVAFQSPGEIVGTAAQWRANGYRVRKGERAAGRLTGRQFWPTAYFTAEQAGAGDLVDFEPELPPEDLVECMRERLLAFLLDGVKGTDAVDAVALGLAGEDVPELKPRPVRRPLRDPDERIDAVIERRARLDAEREAVDAEIAALVRMAQSGSGLTVQGLADRLGLSRQRLYQLVSD